jgi:hypothetical protein
LERQELCASEIIESGEDGSWNLEVGSWTEDQFFKFENMHMLVILRGPKIEKKDSKKAQESMNRSIPTAKTVSHWPVMIEMIVSRIPGRIPETPRHLR